MIHARGRFSGFCLLGGVLAATLPLVPTGCRTSSEGGPTVAPKPAKPAARTPPRPLPREIRAVWVARFHYRSADDIRTIIRNCAESGFNTVFWQVRGEATVSYPSRIEPWSREYGFQDPGFDPLAVAVHEAHRAGLRLEAWFNVMPGWKGKRPPPDGLHPRHVFHAHPDWFVTDSAGRPQPLSENYVILNPCLPEVRRHIAALADEIAARYDVDGLHLDYVRFAWDTTPNAKQSYPRDGRTVRMFETQTGRTPDADPAAWNHWRANQITRLVQEIRTVVNRRRPGASLTAAVWRNPQLGYRDYLQNSVAWLRTELVDALMPMAYTDKTSQFEGDIEMYRRLAQGRRVVPGIGVYLHQDPAPLVEQLGRCAEWRSGYALFSYDSLFPTAGDRQLAAAVHEQNQRQRLVRRDVLARSQ